MHGRPRESLPRRLPALALVLVASACAREEPEPPGLGYAGAASEDLDKHGAPVVPHDLEAVAARGSRLAAMERVLALAFERGLPRVGDANAAILVPVTTIDDGMRSGEVVFYRWLAKDLARDGTFDPDKARRWLVVPMLLLPDRVLELEQFDDRVVFGDEPHRRLSAMKQALGIAQDEFPGGDWRVHSVREQVKRGGLKTTITRVYLLAVAPDAHPDLEFVVEDGRRKRPGKVSEMIRHHDPGDLSKSPIEIRQTRPGVPTVARVLARAGLGDRVEVRGSDGSRWRIDGAGGAIDRLDSEASTSDAAQ